MLFEKSMMKVHLQMAKPTAGYICNLLKRPFADMRRKYDTSKKRGGGNIRGDKIPLMSETQWS